jgi:ubiquinone/menaquinone biosynthesis C-methylase UbiE
MKNRNLNEYSANYIEQPYEKYQVNFRKKKIIEILQHFAPQNIIEVGCGLESIFLEYNDFEKLTIIEPSEFFFKKAKEDIVKNEIKNIDIFNIYFEEFFPKEKVDFIIISSLIHEIVDLDNFIEHLHNIAEHNSIIHINVPNAESFHRLIAFELGLIDSLTDLSISNKEFQQNRVFNLNELENLFKKYNFEIISKGSYSFKPFTHIQMDKIINSNSVSVDIISNLYKIDKYLNGHGSEIFINVKKD